MTDTPPRETITLADWRLHPNSRYSFQHVAEFVPVAGIAWPAGQEDPSPGPGALDGLEIADRDGGGIAALAHMKRSHTDHLVVMRDGVVIAEWLAENADPARVRDLLDMTVDLDFDEEYLDDGGAFDRYRRAMLWNPERAGTMPETMEGFLATLGARGHGHGRQFYYASPNTDLLGLVVERAAGIRYHRFLAERLWRPMGARGAAYVTVDRVGAARAAGGVCITTRDLARLGQLVVDGGRTPGGTQVVPRDWIDDMHANGDRQAWVDGNFADMFANGRYRSCWYEVGDGRGSFAAVGIHGQWLWADPTGRVVIAKTASRPDASDDAATALEILMLSQIARTFE